MSIKYYRLAKDEKPPDEFCAVRDIGGEPGEYMFYVPEAENSKLRKLVRHLYEYRQLYFKTGIYPTDHGVTERLMRELGVEVEA